MANTITIGPKKAFTMTDKGKNISLNFIKKNSLTQSTTFSGSKDRNLKSYMTNRKTIIITKNLENSVKEKNPTKNTKEATLRNKYSVPLKSCVSTYDRNLRSSITPTKARKAQP